MQLPAATLTRPVVEGCTKHFFFVLTGMITLHRNESHCQGYIVPREIYVACWEVS